MLNKWGGYSTPKALNTARSTTASTEATNPHTWGDASKALAKASITMAKPDLWHARLAVKTLRRDQREAIAGVGED